MATSTSTSTVTGDVTGDVAVLSRLPFSTLAHGRPVRVGRLTARKRAGRPKRVGS